MSRAAEGWAAARIRSGDLPAAASAMLMVLADYAHDDGTHVFPYVDTLTGRLGWNYRKVQRALTTLRDLGLIEVDAALVPKRLRHMRPDRRPTVYRLRIESNGVTESVTPLRSRGDSSWSNGVTESVTSVLGTNNYIGTTGDGVTESVTPSTQGALWPSSADDGPFVPAPIGWRDRPAREVDVPLRRRGAG